METPKTNPKPTEEDVLNKPEEEKSVDRDGRERQPTEHSESK